MSRWQMNASVCALLVVFIILSMSSWPQLIEARIPNFSAIQGSLVHQIVTEELARRSLRPLPPRHRSPIPAPSAQQKIKVMASN